VKNIITSTSIQKMSASEKSIKIQRLLRKGMSIKKLCHQHSLKARYHKTKPHLVSLKYIQYKADPGNKVVNEARGVIISTKPEDNYKIVALPYFRFYNHGEKYAASLDWSTTKVLEKLDGSLIILYYHDDEWNFASSGTPDAYGLIDLIQKVWSQLGYNYPNVEDQDKTFMFELCSPENKIVVNYETDRLVLHGVRSIITHQEYHPDEFALKYSYELIQSYDLNSFEDAHSHVLQLNPNKSEGFIYLDANFQRVKDKNPAYVLKSKAKDQDIIIIILTVIFEGESSEFLALNPDKQSDYDITYARYMKIHQQITDLWVHYRDIPDRKTFFTTITRTSDRTPLIEWYNGCLLYMYTLKSKGVEPDIRKWIHNQNPCRCQQFFK